MAMKNHPVDTMTKRLVRKGLDEWPAFRAGHPGSSGQEAIDRLMIALLREGVKNVFVMAGDDDQTVDSLVVFVPETSFKRQAALAACRRFEEQLGCPEPGKWFGEQTVVVRCRADSPGLE